MDSWKKELQNVQEDKIPWSNGNSRQHNLKISRLDIGIIRHRL